LLILEKERNLALEKALEEEKAKVEKLAIDLSLAKDSNERMSKELTLANDSLANLKNVHSELQQRHSSLEVKSKDREAKYDILRKSTNANSNSTLDSGASTSKGCSRCYKIDVDVCVANLAKLEKEIKAKNVQLKELSKNIGKDKVTKKSVFESHPAYHAERYPNIKDGLGYIRGGKANGTKRIQGQEVPLFTQGANLCDLMNFAHGVSRETTPLAKPVVVTPSKVAKASTSEKTCEKINEHKPSPNYTIDYSVMWDHNGRMVVKYVGIHAKKMMKSVWVPKLPSSNTQGPKLLWVPKSKA